MWISRLKVLCMEHCVTVIPDSVCSAVCLEAGAETAADVRSHAGFHMKFTMRSGKKLPVSHLC